MSTLAAIRENETSEIVQDMLSFLKHQNGESAPRVIVERDMARHLSERLYKAAIQRVVDECLVTLVLDYPAKKWDVHQDDLAWHVKLLSSEETRRMRELKPVDLALIKLLQKQNGPYDPGEMSVQEAKERLLEMGFGEQEASVLKVEGFTERFFTNPDGPIVEHIALIPEDEKTPEYKAALEESWREFQEKRALRMMMVEEMEKEEEPRQKRRARNREKQLKRQPS